MWTLSRPLNGRSLQPHQICRVIGDILVHHGSCPNESVTADGHPADHGAVCAQCGPLTHQRVSILALAGNCGAWVVDVGEDHARTTEDIVLQSDIVINRDVVLDLAVVSNPDKVADKDVLSKRTAITNHRSCADMAEVPDLGTLSNRCSIIDDGALVAPPCSWLIHPHALYPGGSRSTGLPGVESGSLQSNHCFTLWSTPTFAAPTSRVLLLIQTLCRHLALFRSRVTVAIRGHRLLPAQVEGQSP